ncbi:MAG: CPBP family intramembrane metalloprotease [Solirubrobacterales bacterium]|nr:CPBP family intramembrane metalloprotease [Solirubrobacterales bacterium]
MSQGFDNAAGPPPPPAPPAPPPTPSGEGGPTDAAWGPRRTIAALVAFLVVLSIEAVVVAAFDPDIDSLAARLTLQALLAGTLLAVAFAAARPGPGLFAPAAALGLRRPPRSWIGPMLIAYFGYIACALVIAALLAPEQEDVTRALGSDEGALGTIVAGLLIVGAAPLTEEIFFRGFLFAGLRRSTPFAVAALISAAIWGVFHYTGEGSWGVVLQLAVFGVALAWLYERTGSIWPTIAVHAFNNALAFTLLTS